MNLSKSTTTTPITTNSLNRSPIQRAFVLILLLLACFTLSPRLQAQLPSPAPDGGYPNGNTAEGDSALFNLTTGAFNTAVGSVALFSNTTADSNTAIGQGALFNNTTGPNNTAVGFEALVSNTTGPNNTAVGTNALVGNTIGQNNAALGIDALFNNTTGSFNIALGFGAGITLTTGDHNIDIGNVGVAGEAKTIRIGDSNQTATYIAGISGAAVTGLAVKVNGAGQLGTPPSAARFKDDIKPMNEASEAILGLKPVTFRYKKEIDPERAPQFGLVAEDVAKVNPDLVARDAKGDVYTVRYDAVNAMLLNEFLKEHQKVKRLEAALAAVNKRLKAQDAKIDRVNAKVELAKPTPQTVAENR